MKIFAHRGISNIIPENSLASFKKAIELKCDGIETDVHLSKDNKLMVFHDFELNRMTNNKGQVCDYYADDLNKMNIGKKFSSKYKYETIPTLNQVLELFKNNDLLLVIELKAGSNKYKDIEKLTIDLLKQYDMIERSIITSFDHRALKLTKEIEPSVKTAMLYGGYFFNTCEYAKKHSIDILHPSMYSTDKELVKNAKENNIPIYSYATNTIKDYLALKDMGVDGVFANNANEIIEYENKRSL